MCGIIGIVGEGATADRARLVAARELMRARGPDDAGLWEAPGVALAARRLAIVDPTPAGHQPMVTPDGRYAVVFNGEVYNHQLLRRDLEREFRFTSYADTEVVLHGYRRWGLRGLVDRLDGMFAFALWDADRRVLVAARDRAGKKPFFYRHAGGSFSFASVANALIRLQGGPVEVDPHAIDAFLVYQAVPAPLSIFRGLRQLPPAHVLRFEAGTGACRVERYWHISCRDKTTQPVHEIVDEMERLARDGVRKRLVADVSVGVFLSGGVDSSIVASLAAQESTKPLDAVTLGFNEPGFDERRYARSVAARAGITLHEELLRPGLVADLPGIVWHYGQPVADVSIVPSYYLAAAAARHMTVVLNGDGGDELFGGYRRPMIEYLVGPYRERVPEAVRRAIGVAFEAYRNGRLSRVAALAHAGSMSGADAFTYDRAFRLFRTAEYGRRLLGAVDDWHPDVLYREAWNRADGPTDIDRALSGDFDTYLPDQLLTKADRSTMAHSLEARSPLLDVALMEYAARIPAKMHFRHLRTKSLLKRLADRFVPPAVVHRRKRGFVMPASAWLRGELADYARAALDNRTFFDRDWITPRFVRRMLEEHFTGVRDWGEQIFSLLVLEVWARITLDRTLDRDARMDTFLSTPVKGPRRRIRTLQVGLEWFAERPGGLNRVYYELARHLPDAGVAVHGLVAGTTAVAMQSDGLVEGFAPHSESIAARGVSLYQRGRAAVRGDPGRLVVAHFALYAYPLLGALGRRPLVVHFQGPWGLEGGAERQNRLVVSMKTAVERAVYRRATAFVVLSRPFGRILEERFGIPASRIHVVPGGVDADRFAIAPSRAECREILGWPPDRKIVLSVRRLARRMGLDDLVASVAQLRKRVPDVLVLIAGRGVIAAKLEHEIMRQGVGDHVRLLGFVPDDRLPHAYRAADLSVVPSVALEGFGLIVAESLAAGTPALVTPIGGLPEAVGTLSPNLVLSGTGPEALANGLADALTGRTAMPSAAECYQYAKAHHDWPVIAARVAAVYEAALG